MWNMREVDNNDTRTTSMISFVSLLLTFDKFYTFIWYFIGDFEQVNAG